MEIRIKYRFLALLVALSLSGSSVMAHPACPVHHQNQTRSCCSQQSGLKDCPVYYQVRICHIATLTENKSQCFLNSTFSHKSPVEASYFTDYGSGTKSTHFIVSPFPPGQIAGGPLYLRHRILLI